MQSKLGENMEVTIEKQKETPLLSRKRVTAMVSFEGATPSRMELRKVIAKKTSSDAEKTIVKHVYQHFGTNRARVIVNVYDDRKVLEKLEHPNLVKKHTPKEEPKKEASAEKAKEKPAEVPKEEAAPAAEEKSD